MSFYRIYRPQTIDEIDNIRVREQLLGFLTKKTSELPHAYLFCGPRGAGKTTAARLIAKLFNCTNRREHGPCGTCSACKTIASGSNMDVLELDAASNRGIDEIRQLKEGIHLSPTSGAYKVYIIDEVHMLTNEAFNALLKTLEEPPPHAVFVLATTDPQKVPATIHSRCVMVQFSKATQAELLSALGRIVSAEKLSIDTEALTEIAEAVDGAFRDAVKLLEQVSLGGSGHITSAHVRSVLSLSSSGEVAQFVSHLATRNVSASLGSIAKLKQEGKDSKTFLSQLLTYLEKQLILSVTAPDSDEFVWKEGTQLRDAIHRFTRAYGDMKFTTLPYLPIELAIVEFCDAYAQKASATSRQASDAHSENVREQKDHKEEVHKGESAPAEGGVTGMLVLERILECWPDIIAEVKSLNHSISGVLRSARPTGVAHGIVTIAAFFPFHKEKLSEPKTKDILVQVFKKLFGETVKIDIVLGKK